MSSVQAAADAVNPVSAGTLSNPQYHNREIILILQYSCFHNSLACPVRSDHKSTNTIPHPHTLFLSSKLHLMDWDLHVCSQC